MGLDETPLAVHDRVTAELVDCPPPPAPDAPPPAASTDDDSPTDQAAEATIEQTGAGPPPEGLRWRIYYDSGSTADSRTSPGRVPAEGVIVIAQAHDSPTDPLRAGRELLYDADHYYWEYGRWWKADAYGRDDYLRRPGWKRVLAGRNTTTETYHALKLRAQTDPDLPPKSAWLPGERRG